MSYIMYSGIPVECAECGATAQCVDMHIHFVNQYGARIRVFCRKCGTVTDRLRIGHSTRTDKLSWKCEIRERKSCKGYEAWHGKPGKAQGAS